MAFDLFITPAAQEEIDAITDPKRLRKVNSCLARIKINPKHPGLRSDRYEVFDKVFGDAVWESYVENHVSSAWRVWWAYGPDRGQIMVLVVRAHP